MIPRVPECRGTLEIIEYPQHTPGIPSTASRTQEYSPWTKNPESHDFLVLVSAQELRGTQGSSWSSVCLETGCASAGLHYCGQITTLFRPWFSHKQSKDKGPCPTCPMELKKSNQTVAVKMLCKLSIPMTALTLIIK